MAVALAQTPQPGPGDDGWRARLDLRFGHRAGRTELVHRRHEGPLRVQRSFHPEGAPCHSYVLHPPGGVVGGDRLAVDVDVAAGAWALLTSPGATKLYRSLGPEAQLVQSLQVADGAVLEWFPQEQIAFTGARARATTRIELTGAARCIAWELACLGRPAAGEGFAAGQYRQSLEVWRDGSPLLLEQGRYPGGGEVLEAPWGLAGWSAFATLVAAGAGQAEVDAVREAIAGVPGEAGVTRLGELLVLRWRGPGTLAGYALRERAWGVLRPALHGREPCRPRIWNT